MAVLYCKMLFTPCCNLFTCLS